jgi:hypothetical protein
MVFQVVCFLSNDNIFRKFLLLKVISFNNQYPFIMILLLTLLTNCQIILVLVNFLEPKGLLIRFTKFLVQFLLFFTFFLNPLEHIIPFYKYFNLLILNFNLHQESLHLLVGFDYFILTVDFHQLHLLIFLILILISVLLTIIIIAIQIC